jgi:hypothetical protein
MSSRASEIGGIFVAAVVLSAAKCGGDASATAAAGGSAAPVAAASRPTVVRSQSANRNPCSWISRGDAQKALGDSVIVEPVRVKSADNIVRSDKGYACLFELPPQGSIKQIVSIAITPDESGAMQTAFVGMGNVEEEFKSTEARHDTLIDGRWDFVSGIPGGLTATRSGRIAMELFTPTGKVKPALALAAAMLDGIPDVPFTGDSTDPYTPPRVPDPCALLTRKEAEAVLGPLPVAPYASSKGTALVYGAGASCAYYSGKHHALVITPMLRHGAEFFKMMGGVDAQVAAKTGGSRAPDTLEGNWDALSVGSDGALHALKGDKMLTVQYKTSSTDFDGAVKLVRAALARL